MIELDEDGDDQPVENPNVKIITSTVKVQQDQNAETWYEPEENDEDAMDSYVSEKEAQVGIESPKQLSQEAPEHDEEVKPSEKVDEPIQLEDNQSQEIPAENEDAEMSDKEKSEKEKSEKAE